MTTLEVRLRELAELPAELPDSIGHAAWSNGRRQRRRRVSIGIAALVLAGGLVTGVAVAHPALAVGSDCGTSAAAACVSADAQGLAAHEPPLSGSR